MTRVASGERIRSSVLVIACGALAREIAALRRANAWPHLDVRCLPAELHNRPERIPEAVREAIRAGRERHATIFVAYGDCGTGGLPTPCWPRKASSAFPALLLRILRRQFRVRSDVRRRARHLHVRFPARHFDRLVIRGLGLDRHPGHTQYFGNYRRPVHLAQTTLLSAWPRTRAADRLTRIRASHHRLWRTGAGLRATVTRMPAWQADRHLLARRAARRSS
jgi:hypothetical protein